MAKTKLQKTLDQARRECEEAGVRLTPKRINVLSVFIVRRVGSVGLSGSR